MILGGVILGGIVPTFDQICGHDTNPLLILIVLLSLLYVRNCKLFHGIIQEVNDIVEEFMTDSKKIQI